MIIVCICTAFLTVVGFVFVQQIHIKHSPCVRSWRCKDNKIQSVPSWNLYPNVYWSTVGQGKTTLKVTTYTVPRPHRTQLPEEPATLLPSSSLPVTPQRRLLPRVHPEDALSKYYLKDWTLSASNGNSFSLNSH